MRRDALYDLVDGVHALTLLRKDVQRLVPSPCSMAARGVLACLAESGPVRLGVLAELTRVDASVTSRQVAQLHAEGLVERVPDPLDGRSSLVAVTDAGRDELNRLRNAVVLSWDAELADWTDQELSDLVRMLRRLQTDLDGARATSHHHHATSRQDAAV